MSLPMMGFYNNNNAAISKTQMPPSVTTVPSLFIKYVDHTYRDYSRYVEEGGELIKHKKSGNNFPARLHQMLTDAAASDQYSDVIAWMPHGRAWKILDKHRLVSEVIPKYYVCKKYESFGRQLNGWGFKRLHRTGPDLGCYYHECFLRDMPEITCLIRRLPTNLGKSTPYAEGEPNFYRIAQAFPLPPPPREKLQVVSPRDATAAVSPGRARAVSLTASPKVHATNFSARLEGGSDPTREIRDRSRSTMKTMATTLVAAQEIRVPQVAVNATLAPEAIPPPSFEFTHQMSALPEAAARATSVPTSYGSTRHDAVKGSGNACYPAPDTSYNGYTNHQPSPYPTDYGPSLFY